MRFSLFEMHPSTRGEFIPFKSIEVNDEQFNRVLRNHGLKVLNTVSKMVHRLEQPDKMVEIVRCTGTRHGDYTANASLVDVSIALSLNYYNNVLLPPEIVFCAIHICFRCGSLHYE